MHPELGRVTLTSIRSRPAVYIRSTEWHRNNDSDISSLKEALQHPPESPSRFLHVIVLQCPSAPPIRTLWWKNRPATHRRSGECDPEVALAPRVCIVMLLVGREEPAGREQHARLCHFDLQKQVPVIKPPRTKDWDSDAPRASFPNSLPSPSPTTSQGEHQNGA